MGLFSQPSSPRQRANPEQRGTRKWRRSALAWLLSFVGAVILSLGLFSPGVSSSQQQSPPTQPPPKGPPAKVEPMDAAIAWINAAAGAYQGVKDYSCTMVKQERVNGVLQPEHVISLKFRNQPFSVYMKWLGPKDMAGQEVAYVHGKNKNMMRVHAAGGIGSLLGFISISPTDPKVQQHSKHVITETGIGNLIARCQNEWQQESKLKRTHVDVAEFAFNQRQCIRLVVTLTQPVAQAYCFRTVVYLDKETRLPVRAECYDWPRQGGPPHGELLEVYSYSNMQFNTGLSDKDFER